MGRLGYAFKWRIEALLEENGAARHLHARPLQLLLEELAAGLHRVDLVHAEGLNPFLHIVVGRGADQHRRLDHACLAEDNPEAVLATRFL